MNLARISPAILCLPILLVTGCSSNTTPPPHPTPAEIAWFMQMLQKSAPTLTPQDTATIHARLTAHGS